MDRCPTCDAPVQLDNLGRAYTCPECKTRWSVLKVSCDWTYPVCRIKDEPIQKDRKSPRSEA